MLCNLPPPVYPLSMGLPRFGTCLAVLGDGYLPEVFINRPEIALNQQHCNTMCQIYSSTPVCAAVTRMFRVAWKWGGGCEHVPRVRISPSPVSY
jgi:hypothetical protein